MAERERIARVVYLGGLGDRPGSAHLRSRHRATPAGRLRLTPDMGRSRDGRIALCAIHHLAFDRNLLGIDPAGVVHIAGRLLREIGPMLRTGLQGFHGGSIAVPLRPQDRPDPHRLERAPSASRGRPS